MYQSSRMYLFGSTEAVRPWSPDATSVAHRSPTPTELQQILAVDEPATFVLADRIRPEELSVRDANEEIVIDVADPGTAADERGSNDLLAALWQAAPLVAILLGRSVLEAGAVRLGRCDPESSALPTELRGDALTAYVLHRVEAGASLAVRVLNANPRVPTAPPALSPSEPAGRDWVADRLRPIGTALLRGPVTSAPDVAAVRAGILLWHDRLDESHAVSQSIEGQGRHGAGDHWHAIMHRREPDYSNAKYWFRRVGRSPIFGALSTRAEQLLLPAGPSGRRLRSQLLSGGYWNAIAFVDACAAAERAADTETLQLLRILQSDEMLLLLLQSIRDARN